MLLICTFFPKRIFCLNLHAFKLQACKLMAAGFNCSQLPTTGGATSGNSYVLEATWLMTVERGSVVA